VASLLLHWHQWADRRVETIEFLDERRVRHHTSVDFTVPEWGVGKSETIELKDMIAVPIAYMRKGLLKNLDVYDEEGAAVPVLTRTETQRLAHDILVGLSTGFVPGAAIDVELEKDFWRLIEDEPATAVSIARALPADIAGDQARRSPLGVLADDFASGFFLFAAIKAEEFDRRILKYDYEEDYVPTATAEEAWTKRFRAWLADQREAAFVWLGWRSLPFALSVPQAALGATYHLEIPAPDELFIRSAELRVSAPRRTDTVEEECVDRAHLYVSKVARGTDANVLVLFTVEPQGLPSAALFTGLLTFSFLAGGLLAKYFLHAHAGGQIAAAIIVAVPGFFAAYLFRPGEHRLLRRVVRGVRIQTGALSVVSFAAGGILAIDIDSSLRLVLWWILTILAGFGLATASVTYLRARWFRHRQPG
jgi:hypothetical protein